MKSCKSFAVFRVISALLVVVVVAMTYCLPDFAFAEIVCADDSVPDGMAITATGTAPDCAGACRARRVESVCGPVMKICAGQPIPRGYALDSVTTMPACACLGSEDAYVIRYVGDKHNPILDSNPEPDYEPDESSPSRLQRLRFPYGDPPFGNLLCSSPMTYGNQPQQADAYRNSTPWGNSQGGHMWGNSRGADTNMNDPAPQGGMMVPWSTQSPQWNDEQDEPFRVGE